MGNTITALPKTSQLQIAQSFRGNNDADKSRYLVYGGLATGIATTAWNLLKADNEPFSFFGMVKKWSIPVVSFIVSFLPVISKLKPNNLLKKSYDLKNVDDMKKVFNKIVWNLIESNQEHFKEITNNLPNQFSIRNLIHSALEEIIVPKSEQLGLDLSYDEHLNVLYIQTQLQMCIKKGLHLYGIRINLHNPEFALNLNDELKVDFISKEVNNPNSNFVIENSINITINDLILDQWIKHIEKETYEDILDESHLQNIESESSQIEDGLPVLSIYNPGNLSVNRGGVRQVIRNDGIKEAYEGA